MSAFTLIEMTVVIAILVILMMAGVKLLSGTGPQSRRVATDLLSGMIDQARTSAITSRSYVILALAAPDDLQTGDQLCRIGLFKVETWPDSTAAPVPTVLMKRWRSLDIGVVLINGPINGIDNPLDGPKLTITYGANKSQTVKVHAIAFSPRGGLHYPHGSTPVVLRIAEGNYRSGIATPFPRAGSQLISENHLKIGRVTARPYRIDG